MSESMMDRASVNMVKRIGRWCVLLGAPVVCLFAGIYAYHFDKVKQLGVTFPCAFLEAYGLYCPGCGNTRAFHALMHFDIVGVFQNNILFPWMLFILVWLGLGEYLRLLLERRVLWLPKKFRIWWVWVALGIVALFTILRNIPVFPFSMLAPG